MTEFGNIKKANAEHKDVCFQIQKMSNFMLQSDVDVSETDSKNKQEACKVLVSSEKYKNEIDTSVFDWKKENAKWLKKRKKLKKPEILDDRGRGESLDIGKAKMIDRLCKGFKPAMLLSDDRNLKNKNKIQ